MFYRYLATGCTFMDLQYSFRIASTTIGKIVRDVCRNIWIHMKDMCMEQLTEDKWKDIINGFKKNAQFPNCLGAVDGKHIRIIQPAQSGSSYYNYKNYFSIILLAVCDSNHMFTFVDIGSYGRHADSTIFEESCLYKMLQEKKLNIPPPSAISQNGPLLPNVFIGDEAFSLQENLMRPYGGKNLPEKKKIFNYRLSRARRYIECTFGILANKWRIFHRPLNVNVDFAVDIVKSSCVLHNYVKQRDGNKFEDTFEGLPYSIIHSTQQVRPGGPMLTTIREEFANYFVSEEGKLDWQWNMI